MDDIDSYTFYPWYPRGVKQILAAGGNHFIALYNEITVLRFPRVAPGEEKLLRADGRPRYTDKILAYRQALRKQALHGLSVEKRILQAPGHHPRIVRLRDGEEEDHEDGLLIEYMPNGSVEKYLQQHACCDGVLLSLQQRLSWALQAAEGLAYVHSKHVLHCDMGPGNLPLDERLQVKLCDFQGRLLSPDGSGSDTTDDGDVVVVVLDGGSTQGTLTSMPRDDWDYCDVRTDRFALGTTIYYIVTGERPFAPLDPVDDEDEIQRRFKAKEYPDLEAERGGDVVRKCWSGDYAATDDVVRDL
ncbi:Protein kinase-like domain protein [Niveomyces insectorum RCEF 264]|uniref:Protein kinase-like domain protein n=1 Tax=Niveomyces insectorum RCEF 264 TaxID=1081102 RepID=A0A167UV13_9HYPO|nr:Protein kinase-like domain protein [Niveomyces insectorum RCEF 264]